MGVLSYTIVLEPAEEGGFNVFVPALPGCVTQGDTQEEAIAMAEEAIHLWVDALAREHKPIPVQPAGYGITVAQVVVAEPSGA